MASLTTSEDRAVLRESEALGGESINEHQRSLMSHYSHCKMVTESVMFEANLFILRAHAATRL